MRLAPPIQGSFNTVRIGADREFPTFRAELAEGANFALIQRNPQGSKPPAELRSTRRRGV